MKKIVRYVIIHYLLTMFNTNKEVKDDICRSRFALFINNIKRDIKRRRHHYREPSRIPIKALKALKHCRFVDKEKQNNDGYTRSMEINKATFMHHAKMPAGHLVPRDAPVGHRRGNNPVEYVVFFFFFFFFVTRSQKSNVEY